MTTFLIIVIILAAAYIFAALTFYYGFKNWHPMCGGKSCRRDKPLGDSQQSDRPGQPT